MTPDTANHVWSTGAMVIKGLTLVWSISATLALILAWFWQLP